MVSFLSSYFSFLLRFANRRYYLLCAIKTCEPTQKLTKPHWLYSSVSCSFSFRRRPYVDNNLTFHFFSPFTYKLVSTSGAWLLFSIRSCFVMLLFSPRKHKSKRIKSNVWELRYLRLDKHSSYISVQARHLK